jgi:hypothetical protein
MKLLTRIILISFAIASVFVVTACSCVGTRPLESYLWVKVSQHPTGGQNINKVSCTYQATYTLEDRLPDTQYGDPRPINLNVYWTNDKGGTYNKEQKRFEELIATGGTYTSSFSPAQAGLYLDKTFWLVMEWNDDNGKHTVTSNKAVCTVR